jgi:hypothetical protein
MYVEFSGRFFSSLCFFLFPHLILSAELWTHNQYDRPFETYTFLVDLACVWDDAEEQYADVDSGK